MPDPQPLSGLVRFGEFQLDLEAAELLTNGQKFILQGQPFQVLTLLIQRPGELVTREEIRKRLWPCDTFVDFDHSLNKAVNRLREALGDSAENPQFVQTVPRRGYRFIARVQVIGPSTGQEWAAQHIPAIPRDARYFAAILGVATLFFALLGFAVRSWRQHERTLDLADIRMTQLTDTGATTNVAISPDGGYVAYTRQVGEKEELRLRQLATRSDLQILPLDIGSFAGLTFSPDGSYIYFVRSGKNDPSFQYLYMIPALGGPAREVLRDVGSAISFSPNTRQFVFTRGAPLRNSVEVRIANSDGTGEKLLATLGDCVAAYQFGATWSPNGRLIALSTTHWGRRLGASLVTVSVSDGSVHELFSSPDPIGRPVWSRREDELLVPMNDPVNRNLSQLWAVSYPEGKARQLTKEIVDHDLRISSTSDATTVARIAVTQVSNVWVADAADLKKAQQITFDNLALLKIAETRDDMILVTGDNGKLWMMHADGSNRVHFASGRSAPAPCGRLVVYLEDTGAMTLMRANLDGSHPAPLMTTGDVVSATCSPERNEVFYASMTRPQKIWRMPVEGGAPVEITAIPGDGMVGRFDISPDGKHIAYAYRNLTEALAPGWDVDVIPVDGGSTERILKVPAGIRALCWAPDGRGIQFLLTLNGASNVWEQRFAGGPPEQLSRFTSGQMFDFSWSPDHSRLLMLQGDTKSDVVLYSNLR
jgi:DNA-binding winged helix-turn-helix (wHTH) protein/Tol biopolymer transport system component